MLRRVLLLLACLLSPASAVFAEPLSKKTEIDFFRDAPSRNLKGLATRSDGRLVAGPTLVELAGTPPADLLWCLEPAGEPNRFLVGTGPDGRVIEVTIDAAGAKYETREVVRLADPQVFTLKRMSDGSILAGTSPKGALYLIRDDQAVARTLLPVDSIFDLLALDGHTVLAATGNPGRIYRIDLAKFAAAGVLADKVTDPVKLAERGIALFGQIRDRNVRRIAALADGRIVAGSSPRGNVYVFAREFGAGPAGAVEKPSDPIILQENRDAEVTDLLPQMDGDLFATIVFSSTTGESRITPVPAPPKTGTEAKEPPPPPAQPERFGGRSTLLRFPANGFVETLAARANTAFYRLARRGDVLLVAGGEQGELAGYDLKARLSLTFSGSISSQLNYLAPLPGGGLAPDKFLVLRNNAPGFAVLDFAASGQREAETRRLDLATHSLLGALRFNRLRNVVPANLTAEIRTSNGSDEIEGWGPWTTLAAGPDAGWRTDNLRGRYLRLRLKINDATGFELDRATLFALPQNRRPVLQDFRVLTPGYSVIPAVEPAPPASLTLNQVIQGAKEDDRRRSTLLNSQVVPSPGSRVVLWTVTDPDGDTLLSTFSIRRDGDEAWTDVVTATRDQYAQFNTRHLADGVYFTRLVATESAPRLPAERLSQTFETDDLLVDHTPPEILEATARRTADSVIVSVRGSDKLALLDGIEVVFSNNVRETVEQPLDGVRDGQEETFVLEVPLARISNATSLEVSLFDLAGNSAARRLTW